MVIHGRRQIGTNARRPCPRPVPRSLRASSPWGATKRSGCAIWRADGGGEGAQAGGDVGHRPHRRHVQRQARRPAARRRPRAGSPRRSRPPGPAPGRRWRRRRDPSCPRRSAKPGCSQNRVTATGAMPQASSVSVTEGTRLTTRTGRGRGRRRQREPPDRSGAASRPRTPRGSACPAAACLRASRAGWRCRWRRAPCLPPPPPPPRRRRTGGSRSRSSDAWMRFWIWSGWRTSVNRCWPSSPADSTSRSPAPTMRSRMPCLKLTLLTRSSGIWMPRLANTPDR